jgi:peptide/nickel transport system ATP-binding protein
MHSTRASSIKKREADVTALLKVQNLSVQVRSSAGAALAVDNVSFDLRPGEVLGIVGESGCGKSLAVLSILDLVPKPAVRVVSGRILLEDRDLRELGGADMRRVRGRKIGMIFQEPLTSLNPLFTVGNQISEAIRTHEGIGRRAALDRANDLLVKVAVTDARRRLEQYPHELSGGMRQRVMIAMALACRPRILIADEPTTALDVTIQAQILSLLQELQREMGMAIILVTHDLGVIANFADRVMIMYAGRCVETGTVEDVLARPLHPYTEGLVRCVESADQGADVLEAIPGTVPALFELPIGCRFAPRCPCVRNSCTMTDPVLGSVLSNHEVACLKHDARAQYA